VVYCVKCGTKNPDDAKTCLQCETPLASVERRRTQREEEMCFGMPSHWGGLVLGVFIVIVGLAFLYRQFVPRAADIIWPLVVIFLGIAVLLGGWYRYTRR